MSQHKKAPIQVGDSVTLKIVDLTNSGVGVARCQGFTVFAPGGLPATKRGNSYLGQENLWTRFALAHTDPSSHRITQCPAHDACGVCQLQHLDCESQLARQASAGSRCFCSYRQAGRRARASDLAYAGALAISQQGTVSSAATSGNNRWRFFVSAHTKRSMSAIARFSIPLPVKVASAQGAGHVFEICPFTMKQPVKGRRAIVLVRVGFHTRSLGCIGDNSHTFPQQDNWRSIAGAKYPSWW